MTDIEDFEDLRLYQQSERSIWTDEHISKKMFAAHLNLKSDEASRNITTIKKTIEWIFCKIPKNSKILDLGCGPGLYSYLLAQKGFLVTGIDLSKHSISYAIKKAFEGNLKIDYRCENYLECDIGANYDAIICIYCDFGTLTPQMQAILLKKVQRALLPEGLFVFDVFKPGLNSHMKERREWNYSAGGNFWCPYPHFMLTEVKHFSQHKVWGSRTIIIEEGKQPKQYITWDRYFTQVEIKNLLNEHGFNISSVNHNLVEKNNFTSNDVMFIKAKKV